MKTFRWMNLLVIVLSLSFGLALAQAGSETNFPADWKHWTPVTTTLVKVGAIPGCDADVSALPQIYQDTVSTYCGVKAGGPGKVAILVKPDAMSSYASRTGQFNGGSNMILHLKDMKVLFVTGTNNGAPAYGIFTEDGKDIVAANGPLSAGSCRECHSGYQAFCVGGQCGKVVK